ncbi:MAG: hypothetical protein JWL90_870, partial [Chthoniobacteraceae bacterium]|nr:hypothetical protein [Chthoniobacteraceae bacterium]
MLNEGLSTAVKDFLREYIHSVEQIEILALVSSAPEREWTVSAIDMALRSNEQSIKSRLAGFIRAGLLIEMANAEGAYRYEPKNPQLAAAVTETIQAYRVRPVLVIETIFKPDGNS